MRTPWSVSVVLLAALGAIAVVYRTPGTSQPEAGGPKVSIVGLQRQQSASGAPVFGEDSPLRLAVEVRVPRVRILGLDPEASQLTRFVDDSGVTLAPRGDAAFAPSIQVDPSGHYLRFFLDATQAPAASARRAQLEGRVQLDVAQRSRVHVGPREQALAVGTRFHLGPYELEIVETGELSWNGHSTLTLFSRQPLDRIGSYRLLTSSGRRVDLTPRAGYASEGGWKQTLEGEEALAAACLAIEVWEETEQIEIPFRMDFELGL